MEGPLSSQLEYAILKITCADRSNATHQDSWGGWESSVRNYVDGFSSPELLSAFKRLWRRKIISLTKPDRSRRDALHYSDSTEDDSFFHRGPFNTTITDDGWTHWDSMGEPRTTVFISHIGAEKAVALRLQELIGEAFSGKLEVFVSSNPTSLGGGEQWFDYILRNLAKAKVVLVLLSPESQDRPWINFEAGFGKGQRSRVIPILLGGLSFDALDYPLKGLQGYHLSQLDAILDDMSRRLTMQMVPIDIAAAQEGINAIQSDLPAKKIALSMEPTLSHPKWHCSFFLENNGNRDIEPQEVTIWVPSEILCTPFRPAIDAAILEVRPAAIGGIAYTEIIYRNYREPIFPDRFSNPERLVPRVSPGTRPELRHVKVEIRSRLSESELAHPIRYKIACKNMSPVENTITLTDRLVSPTH